MSSPNTPVVNRSVFDSVLFGKFHVVFEKSRLVDVAAKVGGSKIKHRGDAGESVYWLCYRFTDHGAPHQLYVTAHGEMGGPEHGVGGVVVMDRVSDETSCPELPANLLPVASSNGLGLGVSYQDFIARLGKPNVRRGNRAFWKFERKTRVAGSPEVWFVMQSVEAEFREGKAVIVTLNQTTSD